MTICVKQLRVTSVLEMRGETGHFPVNYALRRKAPLVAIVSVVQFYPKKRPVQQTSPFFSFVDFMDNNGAIYK